MKRGMPLVLGASVALTILTIAPVHAVPPAEAISGKSVYEQYCAVCHGAKGQGDGPMISELKPKTPDLTLISKHNGGMFPYEQVFDIIDGIAGVRSHGSGQMPIWGQAFAKDSDTYEAHARILELVEYLKSIQGGGK